MSLILLSLGLFFSLFAESQLITEKSLASRNPARICKELNWKLAARKCGQKAKSFKHRAAYENCHGKLNIVTQVFHVPVEDAGEEGPHKSCVVQATRAGELVWSQRYRIYADRIVSEHDKHDAWGGFERKVTTPEGSYVFTKDPYKKVLEAKKNKGKATTVSNKDYFSFVRGKKTWADLEKISSNRLPASR